MTDERNPLRGERLALATAAAILPLLVTVASYLTRNCSPLLLVYRSLDEQGNTVALVSDFEVLPSIAP